MEYNGYQLEQRHSGIAIRAIGKGALPKLLRGAFTGFLMAQKAVDYSLAGKRKKNDDNPISQ